MKVLVCLGRSWHEGLCSSGAQVCSGAGTSVPSFLEDDCLVVPFPDWAGLTLLASPGAFPEKVFALGGQSPEFKGALPPAVKAGTC